MEGPDGAGRVARQKGEDTRQVRACAGAGEREAKQREEAGRGGGERGEAEAGPGEREVEKRPRQGARRPLDAHGRGARARRRHRILAITS